MNAAPLDGWGIVVTRPREAAEPLARALEALGARCFVSPALAIEEAPEDEALRAALRGLAHASLAIFVSANAVRSGLAACRRHAPWPAGIAVAAVGESTAQALRDAGFGRIAFPVERQDSEGLLALPELQDVAGKNIIVFRGLGGREHLKEALEGRGARVAYAECYRRVRPPLDPRPLLEAWDRGEVHAVSALSAETLANFVDALGPEGAKRLRDATLVVPHEAVASHAAARAFGRIAVAAPGAEGIANALSPLRVSP